MRFQFYLLFLAILLKFEFKGQVNLVPNPSFESYTLCPNNYSEVSNALNWSSYRETPDYFNVCATAISNVSIPKNIMGYQYAFQGNAYGGFISYITNIFYREIIGVELMSQLVIGQKYFFSFRINRADNINAIGYSINKLGIRFSTVKTNNAPINNFAHYYTHNVITDTLNWTKLSGSFIADSSYKHMMFGNFFDDNNITIINDGIGGYSYYYLDDVCLSTDSMYCNEFITSNSELINHNTKVKIFPNPTSRGFYIESPIGESITILNSLGEVQYEIYKSETDNIFINTSTWANGLYFVRIRNKIYKLTVNH